VRRHVPARSRARAASDVTTALASGGLVVALALLLRGPGLAGVTVLLAVAWGAAPHVLEVAAGLGARRRPPDDVEDWPPGTVTTVLRLGTEPADVALSSVVMAVSAGPTLVLATEPRPLLDEIRAAGAGVVVAPTLEVALHAAAHHVSTDGVLVTSASAFPVGAAARSAAGRLVGRIGWVVGQAPSCNPDRHTPPWLDVLAARRRSRAADRGLVAWEPDATIVRTELLRGTPIEAGRPWGAWLRAQAAQGWRGTTFDGAVAWRTMPSDAGPAASGDAMRQRAAAADLADAATSLRGRARVLAVAALLREVYAYPALLWLIGPLLVARSGAFPFRCSPLAFVALQLGAAAARWAAGRRVHGVPLHPLQELEAAATRAPGSLRALPAALRRRIRPPRVPLAPQPLLWASVALTLATTLALFTRAPDPGRGVDAVVAVALLDVAALWVVALHAVGTRAWERTTYRLPIDRPVRVAGLAGRTIDGSASGLAVAGSFADVAVGATVAISVDIGGGPPVETTAVVADRRAGAESVLGLSLRLTPDQRARWVPGLFRAAGIVDGPVAAAATGAAGPVVGRRRRQRLEHVVAAGAASPRHRVAPVVTRVAVGAVSAVVACVLALVLLGFRPLVVRSSSMVPTLAVGDVVVVRWQAADRVAVGDIVTFADPDLGGRLVTHRVRRVTVEGGTAWFETRGDANDDSEFWSVPQGQLVGDLVWHVPAIGRAAAPLGTGPLRWALLGTGGALVLVAVAHGSRRRLAPAPA
jgi:signal peptidase I